MARRGGEAAAKRRRERDRQAKQKAKQAKREARSGETSILSADSEAALLQEFARLSAEYQANSVSEATYAAERRRILTDLGIGVE